MNKVDNTTSSKLTAKQERFCVLYASDREFFGNGTQSYIEAYNVNIEKKNGYSTARRCASDNLAKPLILNRINELLEEDGLNDAFVDKQLKFLITQHQDHRAKIAAIKEYNNLKGRIANKIELTGKDGGPVVTQAEVVVKDL